MSGSCVEVRWLASGGYELRDTKQSGLGINQPSITVPPESFDRLFERLRGSSSPDNDPFVDVFLQPAGGAVLQSPATGIELRYDASEISAFVTAADEFAPPQP